LLVGTHQIFRCLVSAGVLSWVLLGLALTCDLLLEWLGLPLVPLFFGILLLFHVVFDCELLLKTHLDRPRSLTQLGAVIKGVEQDSDC